MPFDANLVLADGTEWTYANLVTSVYGTPTSTTRNDGGFIVLDMGSANIKSDIRGLAIVLVFTEAANAVGDALTVVAQESEEEAFGDSVYYLHELCKFDIAAVTTGVILGSELTAALTPRVVIRRVYITHRYVRLVATCTSADDFGVVYGLISPYPANVL